jgi:hypothetical protein
MYNPKDSVCPEGGMDTPDIYIISQAGGQHYLFLKHFLQFSSMLKIG